MSTPLTRARERERIRVMREVSATAVRMFDESGFDAVRMEDVARATGVSVATLYRRFSTKENLVCWQVDEEVGMATLRAAVASGTPVRSAAVALAQDLPDDAVDEIESTARIRVGLIAGHAALRSAARQKAEAFVDEILAAAAPHDDRPLLEREVEVRCVAAAMDAANRAWLRDEGTLRACVLRALAALP